MVSVIRRHASPYRIASSYEPRIGVSSKGKQKNAGPAFTTGPASSGGGGIRTRDLWVMSPTSCRCSTPRRWCGRSAGGWGSGGRARSGLASHGVAPAVLSGAALGHDRVRDGSGWSQNALGHGHDRPARLGQLGGDGVRSRRGTGRSVRRRSTLGHEHGSAPVRYRPSTPRLATGSSARGLSTFERGVSSGSGIPA